MTTPMSLQESMAHTLVAHCAQCADCHAIMYPAGGGVVDEPPMPVFEHMYECMDKETRASWDTAIQAQESDN